MRQDKLEVVKQEMARMNVDILGASPLAEGVPARRGRVLNIVDYEDCCTYKRGACG